MPPKGRRTVVPPDGETIHFDGLIGSDACFPAGDFDLLTGIGDARQVGEEKASSESSFDDDAVDFRVKVAFRGNGLWCGKDVDGNVDVVQLVG